MSKFRITVLLGVAAVYPVGQEHEAKTLKMGSSIDLEVPSGPHATPKSSRLNLPGKVAEDLGAPAVGVATDEPFGDRDGEVQVEATLGAVTVRVYEGSDFTEQTLGEGEKMQVAVTESNRITLAVYAAGAEPK